MKDIETHNSQLAETIAKEYYRVYPYLCKAVKNFVKDHVDDKAEKDYYLSLTDVDTSNKVKRQQGRSSTKIIVGVLFAFSRSIF